MVRTDDTSWGPSINERAAVGNRAHAEAGISIHADGGPTSGHGFHVNVPANITGDAALVENPTVRQRIADALADGLARYFAARG